MHGETKNKLMEISRHLIDTRGIEAVSMRTIGELAGLSRSALYRHFDSKDSLLAAIVVENFIRIGENIRDLENAGNDPKTLLYGFMKAYYAFGVARGDHYRLMFGTKWDEEKYPEIKEAASALFSKAASIISRAMPSGPADPRIVIKKTAILYAFIHGLVELHLAGHDQDSKGLENPESLISEMLGMIIA